MSVKLEISGNYFKITDGSNNPIRYPYRDIRFYANELNEYIEFFNHNLNGRLVGRIGYDDEPAEGSVTIDTTSATHATEDVIIASPVANTFANNTAQCTSCIVGDTCTANGLLYTAVSGTPAEDEFDIDTGDNETATSLAAQISADTRSGTIGDLSATSSTDTVTMTTDVLGVAGNATTLSQTGGTITVGNATFENGVTADTVLVDELVYTAVAGAKNDDTEFSIDSTDDATATDLADSIDDDTRVGTAADNVTATATTDTVTIVSEKGGTIGNATLLSSSNGTRLAVGDANLTGGLNDASFTGILIDSIEVMDGAEFEGDYPDALATAVALSITTKVSVPNYNAVSVANVITITAADDDIDVNGFVVAATVVKATKTEVNMAGAVANIVDSNGDTFVTWAALITFLEENTGGELLP